jgi:Fe-Mn family superoxide dismutase
MFEQVKLNYGFSDLEPHIDTATMEVHYTGHHATYTKALNDLVKQVPLLKDKPLEQVLMNLQAVPEEYRNAVRNNGGGFLNHNIYFESLSPGGAREPNGSLKNQIEKDFGNYKSLCEGLTKAALGQFGSGYAWLLYCTKEKRLLIKQTGNQEIPMADEHTKVLLPIDVWEHAYYLKFRNKRVDYVAALFNVIDWDVVARRYE